jgi:DNA-binding MarR family transcriptional regulator
MKRWVLDSTEPLGLVSTPSCSFNLTLTEAGRSAAEQVGAIVPAVLDRRLVGFTSLEFATLDRLLRKLPDE